MRKIRRVRKSSRKSSANVSKLSRSTETYKPANPTGRQRQTIRTGLMNALSERRMDTQALAEELRQRGLRIGKPRLQELAENRFKAIKRVEFEYLAPWCHEQNYHFITWADDAGLWNTITKGTPCTIFRGSQSRADEDVRDNVHEFLELHGHRKPLERVDEKNAALIANLMRTQNCFFLGGPRRNPASEVALAEIFGATPFDPSPENRSRIRVRFVVTDWPREVRSYASIEPATAERRNGLLVVPDAGVTPVFLPVTYVESDDEFLKKQMKGIEAGLFIVVKNPLDSRKNVVSVITAGFGALSTMEMTKNLWQPFAHDTTALPLTIRSDELHVRILMMSFRKAADSAVKKPGASLQYYSLAGACRRWRKESDRFFKEPHVSQTPSSS